MESKVASSSLGLAVGAVAPNADRAMAIGGPEPWRKKGVFLQIYGCFLRWWYPKMDGENNGKTLWKWDDLGVPSF